jgi:ribA/ribD-fused uncharacterized protein
LKAFTGDLDFCSNFYDLRPYGGIEYDGLVYPSLEHAYQAAKTLFVNFRELIRTAPTAGKAKALGKKVTLREGWNEMRVSVMEKLLRKKFAIPELNARLLETATETLVEVNSWHDQEWGDCDCRMHQATTGKNWLGQILMKIREELNTQSSLFDASKQID